MLSETLILNTSDSTLISYLVLLMRLLIVTLYPMIIPLGKRGGVHDTLNELLDITNTSIVSTIPGAV